METETFGLVNTRQQKVVKSNALIQRSRQQLSVQQQKALLFLISQIKPTQQEFEWQTFDIADFCRVCAIETESGKNYKDVKEALKGLSDKSMWITLEDGTENLSRWLHNVQIDGGGGKIRVRFDEYMRPYLLDLKEKFTQFNLIHVLAMKSKYSIQLYQLLKSYENKKEGHSQARFELPRLKDLVGIEYQKWYDIRRFVLDIAIKEINSVSDVEISYTATKKGKAVASVLFDIRPKPKDSDTQIQTQRAIMTSLQGKKQKKQQAPMPGQLSL